MKVASIDIGSNSVLLLIAESTDSGLVPIVEASTITRLGQGVDRDRRLHQDAVTRTLHSLENYAQLVKQHRATQLDVVTTSAARDATGIDNFLDQAEQILGRRPRVIGGEQEAQLTFLGAVCGLALGQSVAVFDIGGGSTEIAYGFVQPNGQPVLQAVSSLDIGCVRITERYIHQDPPSPVEIEAAHRAVDKAFETLDKPLDGVVWVGIGGTITSLVAANGALVPYDATAVHGASITAADVTKLAERLRALPVAQRCEVPGLEPKRADVIVGGACIVERLLAWAGQESVLVSSRGVQWGLALEMCANHAHSQL